MPRQNVKLQRTPDPRRNTTSNDFRKHQVRSTATRLLSKTPTHFHFHIATALAKTLKPTLALDDKGQITAVLDGSANNSLL